MVPVDLEVSVDESRRYASRGGTKLENAMTVLGIESSGRLALDAGASTGGFTDYLLQHGAKHVAAVDVGYGSLAWELRNDPRVTVLERTNVRTITSQSLGFRPDLAVCDLSFIGLEKVLPAIFAVMSPEYDLCALVKPQFEVGPGLVGKGGVVRDPELRRGALSRVARFAHDQGQEVLGFAPSGLPGPKGNRETFIHIAEGGRSGGLTEFDAAISEVDA